MESGARDFRIRQPRNNCDDSPVAPPSWSEWNTGVSVEQIIPPQCTHSHSHRSRKNGVHNHKFLPLIFLSNHLCLFLFAGQTHPAPCPVTVFAQRIWRTLPNRKVTLQFKPPTIRAQRYSPGPTIFTRHIESFFEPSFLQSPPDIIVS